MACGSSSPQQEMLRVIRRDSRKLELDLKRRAGGRGGYLHRNDDCWARFARRKGHVRSFRAAVERTARKVLVLQLHTLADNG
jgi:predicted RNA-binding protein YlxR (DUF448 family)